MVHFGKTLTGELQIVISEGDVESLRQMILSASLLERRKFNGLKDYIEENFPENSH